MKIQNPHLYAAVMLIASTFGLAFVTGIVIALVIWQGFDVIWILCGIFVSACALYGSFQHWLEQFRCKAAREERTADMLARHERLAKASASENASQKYAEGGVIDPYKQFGEKIFADANGCDYYPRSRMVRMSPALGAPYGQAFEFRVRGKTWHRCTKRRADYLIAKFSKYYEVRSYKPTGMQKAALHGGNA